MPSPHLLTDTQYDVTMSPLPDSILFERDVAVVMRDGITIRVNVFRPKTEGKYPVVMSTSPYGKDAFNTIEAFKHVPGNHIGHISISDHVTFEAPDPGFWVPNGYVVVQVDTRGQGTSEGVTQPWGPVEQQDYVELIAWAAAQSWSNGNVGLCGVSYLCISQYLVAQHRPAGLKAIIPWEGFNDFYNFYYPGGIPEVAMWPWVEEAWIKPMHNPDFDLLPTHEQAAHPLKDDYWESVSPKLSNIDVPALICASFSDQGLHSRDTFEAYRSMSCSERWLWSHRQPKWHAFYGQEELAMQKRFFDRFLKGDDSAMEGVAKVRYEVNESRNVFTVHEANQWPPKGVAYSPIYLTEAGLSAEHSTTAASVSYSPLEDGRAQFDLVFDRDTTIVGPAKLKLWVEVEGADDMDLFVGLQKIDAQGNEVYFYGFGGVNPNDMVARGWLRASHRELDTERSTEARPVHTHRSEQKLSAGEIVPVQIEILPAATLFRKGETLRLVVQGQTIEPNAILVKMVPNNAGQHILHFGGKHDAHLLLPILSN